MSLIGDVVTPFLRDTIVSAKYGIVLFRRQPGWFASHTFGPLLALAPFAYMADTFLGEGSAYRRAFVELTGYTNYIGYLVIPLIAVNLSNTAFSAVSQRLREEQLEGTLERLLMSTRFPATLLLGTALAHLVMLAWFVAAALLGCVLLLNLTIDVDPLAGAAVVLLHLVVLYGTAFGLSSLFLWIHDAYVVSTVLTRILLGVLAGATFPIAVLPPVMQAMALMVPFTWIFDLERRTFLRAEPVHAILSDCVVVLVMAAAIWCLSIWAFTATLRHARRTGVLGIY